MTNDQRHTLSMIRALAPLVERIVGSETAHELEELRAYRQASRNALSIQEQSMVALSARVEELRAEVAELRAENARLRAQLEDRAC